MIEKNRKKKSRVDLDGIGAERHQVRAIVPKFRHIPEHEEEQLRQELMPYFVRPIFGPSELEPLQLVGLNSCGRHHQVPASISRYLKPYQREGVTFMYNKAIMLKRGVILGDGEYYVLYGVHHFSPAYFSLSYVICLLPLDLTGVTRYGTSATVEK